MINFMDQLFCSPISPKFLLFSENVPPLVYYSHLPLILISAFIAFFIFYSGKKVLQNQIFFWTLMMFSVWVLLDSIFWATNRSDIIMYVWALTILIEPFIFAASFYLIYVLLRKEDLSFKGKLGISILLLPLIVLTPTDFFLSAFDMNTCLSTETVFSYYTYVVEAFFILAIVFLGFDSYRKSKDPKTKNESILLPIGTVLFLLAFTSGNIIGSLTDNWDAAQYGLFGMPIFIGFLAYSIVKFKTFNLKVIGANLLVVSLWVLIASSLFINDLSNLRTIIEITLVISFIFGIFIIRGVRNEVLRKEEVQKLADNLQKANTKLKELDKQKTEFVSFATHQLRSPLTAMKGYSSLILDGDYGELNPDLRKAIQTIQDSSNTLASVVDSYLNISRIELGTMKYDLKQIDFNQLVDSVLSEQMPNVEKAGISLSYIVDRKQSYLINADQDKFRQVVMNLIDNSIKYTPKGSIHITLTKQPNRKLLFSIKDTGIGMKPEMIPTLFEKFTRANNANAVNIRGTGLGLYVAKEIIKAHGGRIWAESEGEGKGSQFFIEIDEKM